MKKHEVIDISDKIDAVNTSESDSNGGFLFDSNLIIPYVNLDIIKNGLTGPSDTRCRIEYCYLIFTTISEIVWMGENQMKDQIFGRLKFNSPKTQFVDWVAFEQDSISCELKIGFDKLYIFIPNYSRYGLEWYTPRNTPNFSQNMDVQKVMDFFEIRNLPNEVSIHFQFSVSEIKEIEITQGDKKDRDEIIKNWSKNTSPNNV